MRHSPLEVCQLLIDKSDVNKRGDQADMEARGQVIGGSGASYLELGHSNGMLSRQAANGLRRQKVS